MTIYWWLNQNKKVLGFMLILKRRIILLTIDLIATKKKYRKRGVATSLINYTNNKIMGKKADPRNNCRYANK